MGTKINPNILRLGVTKYWDYRYFENKCTETPTYAFKVTEIQKFIYKFFKDHNLLVADCKLNYSDGEQLSVFISFYKNSEKPRFLKVITQNKKQKLKKKLISPLNLLKVKNCLSYQKISYNSELQRSRNSTKKVIVFQRWGRENLINYLKKKLKAQKKSKRKKYFNKFKNNKPFFKKAKTPSLPFFNRFNETKNLMRKLKKKVVKIPKPTLLFYQRKSSRINFFLRKSDRTIYSLKINSFLQYFFIGLHKFTANRLTIFATFQQLNKSFEKSLDKKNIKVIKESISGLSRFSREKFFKKNLNALLISTRYKNKAQLIANLIATQLPKLKRHSFFLYYVQEALNSFIQENSNLKSHNPVDGVKIKITGRINRSNRAKSKFLVSGCGVPVLSIKSDINYAEQTAYTPNGTIGVKIWTYKKINAKRAKTDKI